MLKVSSKKGLKIVLFLLTLAACIWIINFRPVPSHLGMQLTGEAQGRQKIELRYHYIEKSEAKGITFKHTHALNKSKFCYFSHPRQFTPDAIVVDMGVPPSTWTIDHITVHVDFLLFGFDGYQWDIPAIQALANPIESSVIFKFNEKFKIDVVKGPGRFVFALDHTKAQPTKALILAKLACILILISIVVLVTNGYLWRLFQYRGVDLTALENSYSFIHTERRAWLICGAILLGAVLLFMLFPHLQSPGLHIEDTMEFSDLSSERIDLLNFNTYEYYRGYRVLMSEWLAAMVNLLPLMWQPYLCILLSSSLLYVAVIAAARSGIYSSRLVLTIAPTVLFFGAFTSPSFYITLTGILFSSTTLLMVIAFRPSPTSIRKLCGYFLLIAILAWSGPYGAVLLPFSIALLLFLGTRRNIVLLSVIGALAITYIMSAQSGMVQLSNAFDPGIRMIFFRYLVEHVLLLNLFPGIDYPIGFAVIFTAVALLIAYRRDTLFVKMGLIFLATSLTSFITYFLSFKFNQHIGNVLSSHTVIAQFCWLLFILLCIDRIANTLTTFSSKIVLTTIIVVVFSFTIINKQRILAERVELLPDPGLKHYLSAVDYAKSHSIDKNEFLQLWYVNRLGFVTSYHKGDGLVSVSPNNLPHFVQPYHLTQDLHRQQNTLLIYDRNTSVINTSTVTGPLHPVSVEKPSH